MAAAQRQLLAQMASNSGRFPSKLYDLSLLAVVNGLDCKVTSLERIGKLPDLPLNLLIDIYEMMSKREDLKDTLYEELSNLDVFRSLLRSQPARSKLLRIVSHLIASNKSLPRHLSETYVGRYELPMEECKPQLLTDGDKLTMKVSSNDDITAAAASTAPDAAGAVDSADVPDMEDAKEDEQLPAPSTEDELAIDLGLRLGNFLSECGWMQESIAVLSCLNERLKRVSRHKNWLITRLDCLQLLLYAESAHCNFKMAQVTFAEIMQLKPLINRAVPTSLIAMLYKQISAMYFARNEFNNSHLWGLQAMQHLEQKSPARVVIDVLRQTSKACVVKRDFSRANLTICQALRRAREHFGTTHQKYADALLDYGYFLLNVDSVFQSVHAYKEALEVRRGIFGNMNFHVAIAHEDLSYAFYVHEYSTGDFSCAQDHVEKAVSIMKNLVPGNHLMLASAKRVKALLLEEIALDKIADGMDEEELLIESEQLHMFALQLSLEVFGEVNVQTAKHYGNLGRLYQTMCRFEEAESMHKKAIKIKTDLLGAYDYEVGLSIGHLASLYNYQMKKFRQAEELYLRSIDISLRLFGRTYSGLEYDYLGLCHVYETLHEFEKYLRYAHILENWQLLRGVFVTQNKSSYPAIEDDYSTKQVQEKFFEMTAGSRDNSQLSEQPEIN